MISYTPIQNAFVVKKIKNIKNILENIFTTNVFF